jgi:hypothetical protein
MFDSRRRELATDLAVGSASGLGATLTMEYASSWLYGHVESEDARRREEELREAMPTVVMARKANAAFGQPLSANALEKLGTWLHFGFGTAWGPVYAALRSETTIPPLALGAALGSFVSLVFDEGLTPAAGLSPPNRAFPWQTHVRGYLAHLLYGIMLAAFTEACWRMAPRRRRRRDG